MDGKVQMQTVETRTGTVIKKAPYPRELMVLFSHGELKRYARSLCVETGKTKTQTIHNLIKSGMVTVLVQLGN